MAGSFDINSWKTIRAKLLDFVGRTSALSVSTITIAALLFTIWAGNIFSNVSLYSTADGFQLGDFIRRLHPGTEDELPMVPRFNSTEEERIKWFQQMLPKLSFFEHNTSLAERFNSKVATFFGNGCAMQFYMTWFSPVKKFRRRDVWAVESLFKVHPNACLLIVSTTMESRLGYRILNPFIERGYKVLPVAPNLPFLVEKTPAESWLEMIKNGTKDPGIFFVMNLSNLIRLALLYKYGGVYVDTDFVFLKNVSTFHNVVGAQSIDPVTKSWTRLNGAIMIFDKGSTLLYKFLEDFALAYNGNKWGHNGPYMVSRVVARVSGRPGYQVTVMPPKAFYPLDWSKIGRLFSRPQNASEESWAGHAVDHLEKESYGLHLWNKKSGMLRVEEGSPLSRLYYNHCIICGKAVAL